MEITAALTEHLAHLARLHFSDSEKEAIRQDLQKMVGFVEKLAELDTENVQPLLHMSPSVNVWRDDRVQGSVSRAEALRNASGADEAFFKVPKVIRK